MTYIATFFTHFAAVNFSRQLREAGQKFFLDSDIQQFVHSGVFDEDVDTVYLVQDDNYTPVYENHIR